MPLTDELYEFNSLQFGGSTDYSLTYVDGLDTWDARDQQIDKALDHGAFTYTQFIRPRVITFQGFIIAEDADAVAPLVDNLGVAFGPQGSDLDLNFKWSGQVEKFVKCKPTRKFLPRTNEIVNGYAEFALQLLAGDPRKYAVTESSLVGDGTADNEGTFPTPPVVTISGVSNTPRITNTTLGEYLELDTTSSGGDSIVIDFSEKTIRKNGVSIYSTLDAASSWWQLDPGNNVIDFSGISGTATLTWRSAWH